MARRHKRPNNGPARQVEKPHSDHLLQQLLALHPRLIDLSLDRMWRLLSALDHPQDKCPPIIHIAGTNGKGSTAAMLRAMLEADGHKVHAYHSPHLVRFHERILLGGAAISEAHLADILARVERANDGAPITFFEVTTAAAFLAFSEHPADYLILEVGLGGRLDATNVITAKRSAITAISFDHQEFLGDTLLSIAEEKAGILKLGVPAIIARQEVPEVADFLARKAEERRAPTALAGQDFTAWSENGRLVFQQADALLDLPLPALSGTHQIDNAATAVALALSLGVDTKAIGVGLETVRWPARLTRLKRGPLVEAVSSRLPHAALWLDGGHNAAAAAALAAWLAGFDAPKHIVLAMLANKAHDDYLAALADSGAHIHAVPLSRTDAAIGEGGVAPEALSEQAAALGLSASAHGSIEAALAAIDDGDALILIAGSLYQAGVVLAQNG